MESTPQETSTPHKASTPQVQSWLWRPNLIVFVSNACIMILELVAGRIIAPYVGVSLYTWTSVIGVILAGISLGNYVGGRLADRWASTRLLGSIYIFAGLTSLGILSADTMEELLTIDRLTTGELHIIIPIVLLTVVLFFLPSAVLGMISPIVAKLAVSDLTKTGITVGKIYAFGAMGSIVGTFATGFWLISWFGTHVIVWGVAVVLLLLGTLILLGKYWMWTPVAVLVIAVGSILIFRMGWTEGPCKRETNYFCIKVQDEEKNGETVRVLILDRLVHSYTSLTNPTHLVYGYEKVYAEATAYCAAHADHPLRALFIGGGGYTFPRYMEVIYPDSELDVIEIDPGVTEIAYDELGLSRDTRIVSYNEDARMFLERPPDGEYDLVMGDAFNDFSVPYHLTTREFNDRVRAWLTDDGLYVVNIIDGGWGRFLRAYVHTMRQTFDHVYLAPTIESWRTAARSTFVIIGTDTPLDMDALDETDGGDGYAQLVRQLLTDEELDALLAETQPVTLTDRYAPVDQMLAAVFLDQAPKE
jgi:spermidine synthase